MYRNSKSPVRVASLYLCLIVSAALALPRIGCCDIVLTGTQYFQNFDSIGSGLPSGITARTGASPSSLGTSVSFTTSADTWGDTSGAFKNLASVTGLSSGATTTAQNNATDRALGVRQTGGFGDPGASFTFQVQDTLGFGNFTLSFQSEMASVQERSTTWSVQWTLGAAPISFTTLGTISDTNTFGEETKSFALPSTANNQSSNLWIRVVALSSSTGANSRDTYSIDNFKLTYSAVPEASAFLFGTVASVLAGMAYMRRRVVGLAGCRKI